MFSTLNSTQTQNLYVFLEFLIGVICYTNVMVSELTQRLVPQNGVRMTPLF